MSWFSGLTSSDGTLSLVTCLESDEEGRVGDFVSKVRPYRWERWTSVSLDSGMKLGETLPDKTTN
jgi:hypothetical protein